MEPSSTPPPGRKSGVDIFEKGSGTTPTAHAFWFRFLLAGSNNPLAHAR